MPPKTIEETPMDRDEILTIIRDEKAYLQRHFGLLSIGLFGSYARDEQRPGSDIDLLVELSEASFDSLAGLQIYLEGRLGQPIEIIRKHKRMRKRFLNRIEKDIHYA